MSFLKNRRRKKKARQIRKNAGVVYVDKKTGNLSKTPLNKQHQPSTHLMVDDIKGNPTKKYHVWPSIGLDEKGNYKHQTDKEAYSKGEMFTFRSKKKAEKFAAGSWKKGKAKRKAMKTYRQSRKGKSNPYI